MTTEAIVHDPAIGIKTIGNHAYSTITGPIMIPDLKMFRSSGPNGTENCDWYFSAETIKHLQKTFTGKIKIGND